MRAAAGELAVDKTPRATDRTAPPAVAGRVLSGAQTGHAIAGAPGAVAAAVAAAAGTFPTWRALKLVVDTTGLPDPSEALFHVVYGIRAAAAMRALGG